MRRKFFGSAGALPSRKNYSPLATRCRFWLGRSLALPFIPSPVPRPTPRSVFVPCPMSPAPLKSVRVDELRKMRYGFMGKTQIDG
jgi:hypothetical protein